MSEKITGSSFHDIPLTLIGPGSVGSALLRDCAEAQWPIRSVGLRSQQSNCPPSWRSIANPVSEMTADRIGSWVIITVPDDHIPLVVDELGRIEGVDWGTRSVTHLSGVASSSLLEPLRAQGARTASCHPIQTFARDQTETGFRGIHVTMEGDGSFLEELTLFWNRLGTTAHRMDRSQKSQIHLAAVFLSNYLVSIASVSEEILKEVIPEGDLSILAPLLQKTTDNLLNHGPDESLTGPIERGDLQTLQEHLMLMEGDEERTNLYRQLGRIAVDVASRNGQDPETTEALLRLLVGKKKP